MTDIVFLLDTPPRVWAGRRDGVDRLVAGGTGIDRAARGGQGSPEVTALRPERSGGP